MPTQKKPSKAAVKVEVDKDYDKIITALKKGAKVIKTEYWNKVEYGVEYPTGGYFRITKRHYDKVTKEYNS